MKCPNCNAELEQLSEKEFWCEADKMTIFIKDGKAKAQLGKGRLQTIEEAIAELQRRMGEVDGQDTFPFFS
jgi:hypothetical protein